LRQYEAIVILKPELQGDALQISFKEIVDVIKKYQCDVEDITEWGRRPLAYNIAKVKEGFYYLIIFKGKPESISRIRKEFSLNENILRCMITHHKEKDSAEQSKDYETIQSGG